MREIIRNLKTIYKLMLIAILFFVLLVLITLDNNGYPLGSCLLSGLIIIVAVGLLFAAITFNL